MCCAYLFNDKYFFRQLLFGEHDIRTEQDCNSNGKCNPEAFTRKPAKIIPHEEYNFGRIPNPYDIGKIRKYLLKK